MALKNYYDILGIDKSVSQEDIKKAYRRLSLKFHPDKNEGDSFFEEMFKNINEANEVLSNTEKKKEYDELLNKLNDSYSSINSSPKSDARYDAYFRYFHDYHETKKNFDKAKNDYNYSLSREPEKLITTSKVLLSILGMIIVSIFFKPSSNNLTNETANDAKDTTINEVIKSNTKLKQSSKFPEYSTIKKVLSKIRADTDGIFFSSAEIVNETKIEYKVGHFTESQNNECIVIIPMETGRYVTTCLLLMHLDKESSKWVYSGYFNTDYHNIKILDVNNDGISEIIGEGGGGNQGEFHGYNRIFSIKNKKDKIIYSDNSFDSSGSVDLAINPGDTTSKTITITIIDQNNDNIKEIEQLLETEIVESYSEENGAKTKTETVKKILYFRNDTYVK